MKYQGSLSFPYSFRLIVCDFSYYFDAGTKYHQHVIYGCDLFLLQPTFSVI